MPKKDDFRKMFDQIAVGRNRYEIWQDFITLTACSIASACDPRQEREELYKNTIAKYRQKEQERLAETAAMYFELVDENPYQDLLGDLYMRLELGNIATGQFFTPYHISLMMARMQADNMMSEIETKGFTSVTDCAAGGGAMLIAAAHILHDRGINYQQTCMFVAQELLMNTALMCYIQLSMLGCAGFVKIGDTLRNPIEGDLLLAPKGNDIWVTPMYHHAVWSGRRLLRGYAI